MAEIQAAEALAEAGKESRLSEDQSTCDCKFVRSYWLPCRHVIFAYEFLSQIEEPDWLDYTHQFDESGFEVYLTRGLVEVDEDNIQTLTRDLQAKLNTSEALDHVRTRFFELSEFTDLLDADEKDRLLKRWEDELADFSSAFIGRSLEEWLNRGDEVILF